MTNNSARERAMKMEISKQRLVEIGNAYADFRIGLEMLHAQGERGNGCIGWPECDCRLAEQIRGIVHIENEWEYRAKAA